MTVRQHEEERERRELSPYACFSGSSRGREREEEPCDIRTCFLRDRDRIIHSKSFRRLKHKTQVFISPEGDHYRTRLTHTLEVSGIARTIARALRLNEGLCEAIAMGHDLGHTPFGHGGERELSALTDGRFHHSRQSVRVAQLIERSGKGLNLTHEVLDGIVCHSGDAKAETLEGRIVALSDRIAYINHDIDDACRAGLLHETDIPREYKDVLGHRHSKRINTLVLDTISASTDKNEISMSPEVHEAMMGLRKFMFERVYRADYALRQEEKVRGMIAKLFEYYIRDVDRLPEEYRDIAERDGADIAVCDHIACMTDRYALNKYSELFLPISWNGI
ncbi:MAG: deoxyguanosinetriphosphate triphosphohydrolase [Oscillospiraceae bacterium]|nr:deoxyguanosinetriphosphate triphosphohydrolase [Oscillospiraceae bacterium]MBQ6902303.1 deoxyguanosinetriphosphate triphosphohydrolase [Oscillospiraceae bacterium]